MADPFYEKGTKIPEEKPWDVKSEPKPLPEPCSEPKPNPTADSTQLARWFEYLRNGKPALVIRLRYFQAYLATIRDTRAYDVGIVADCIAIQPSGCGDFREEVDYIIKLFQKPALHDYWMDDVIMEDGDLSENDIRQILAACAGIITDLP